MHTTISDIDITTSDITTSDPGYAAAAPGCRPRAAVVACDEVYAGRSGLSRPPSGVVRYDHTRVPVSESPHPRTRVEQARIGLAMLALAALLSAVAVGGLFGLAQWRADSATSVVQTHAGEPLAEVAAQVAPSAVRETVHRIVQPNFPAVPQAPSRGTVIVPAPGR
jgi:hypothetical protein